MMMNLSTVFLKAQKEILLFSATPTYPVETCCVMRCCSWIDILLVTLMTNFTLFPWNENVYCCVITCTRCCLEAHEGCRFLGLWRLASLCPPSLSSTSLLKLWWSKVLHDDQLVNLGLFSGWKDLWRESEGVSAWCFSLQPRSGQTFVQMAKIFK